MNDSAHNPTNRFPVIGAANAGSATCVTRLSFCTLSYFSGFVNSGNGRIPCLRGCNPINPLSDDAIVFIGVQTFVNLLPVSVSTFELDACNPTFLIPHNKPCTEIIHLPNRTASTTALSVAVTIPPLTNPSSTGNPNPHFCGSPLSIPCRWIPLKISGWANAAVPKLNASSLRLYLSYILSKNDGELLISCS